MTSLLTFSLLYRIKQLDSMLPCVCSLLDHRRRQNMVKTSVTHSPNGLCVTFLFLPLFDGICDLLLNRRTATWNLFVQWSTIRVFVKVPMKRNFLLAYSKLMKNCVYFIVITLLVAELVKILIYAN